MRGPKTVLSEMFINLTAAKNLDNLIEGIDMERYQPHPAWPLCFLKPLIWQSHCGEVITWLANELGESACGVIRQLGIEREEFEIVMAGSVFDGGNGNLYIEPLRQTIHELAPKAKMVKLGTPPVVGGVILAMQKVGLSTTSVHKALIESTKNFVREE